MDSNIKNLKWALKNHLKVLPDKTICEAFFKKINDKKRLELTKLIQLILDLKIKNLDKVKTILESCDYSFNYNSPNFTDLYCVALKKFIDHDLYDGKMIDTYHFKNADLYKSFSTENDVEKYILLLYYILNSQYNNEEMKDTAEYFLYELHLNLETQYDDRPISPHNQLFYPQMNEYYLMRRFITLFEEKDNSTESTKLISSFSLESLIKIFIMAFVDDFYFEKANISSPKPRFRTTIRNIQKNHYKRVFMEWLWDDFDYIKKKTDVENSKSKKNLQNNTEDDEENQNIQHDYMQWLSIESAISYDKYSEFYEFFCNPEFIFTVDNKEYTYKYRIKILLNYLCQVVKTMLGFEYTYHFSILDINSQNQEIEVRLKKIIDKIK